MVRRLHTGVTPPVLSPVSTLPLSTSPLRIDLGEGVGGVAHNNPLDDPKDEPWLSFVAWDIHRDRMSSECKGG
jgi:hypothetical protein